MSRSTFITQKGRYTTLYTIFSSKCGDSWCEADAECNIQHNLHVGKLFFSAQSSMKKTAFYLRFFCTRWAQKLYLPTSTMVQEPSCFGEKWLYFKDSSINNFDTVKFEANETQTSDLRHKSERPPGHVVSIQ